MYNLIIPGSLPYIIVPKYCHVGASLLFIVFIFIRDQSIFILLFLQSYSARLIGCQKSTYFRESLRVTCHSYILLNFQIQTLVGGTAAIIDFNHPDATRWSTHFYQNPDYYWRPSYDK